MSNFFINPVVIKITINNVIATDIAYQSETVRKVTNTADAKAMLKEIKNCPNAMNNFLNKIYDFL